MHFFEHSGAHPLGQRYVSREMGHQPKWDTDSRSYKKITVDLVCEQQDSCVFIAQLRTLDSDHTLANISVHACLVFRFKWFKRRAPAIITITILHSLLVQYLCVYPEVLFILQSLGSELYLFYFPSTGPLFFLSCFSFVVGIAMLYYCGGESYNLTKKSAGLCVTGFLKIKN